MRRCRRARRNEGRGEKALTIHPVAGPYWTPAGSGSDWVTVLLDGAENVSPSGVSLHIIDGSGASRFAPDRVVPSPVWPGVHAVRFKVAALPEGSRYRLSGDGWTMPVLDVPRARQRSTGQRFLILSDLQLLPLVGETLRAAAGLHRERAFDAILFPGDMVEAPERKEDWWGDASGRAFFDLLGRPDGTGILPTALLLPCPGNHDVSASRGSTPSEKLNNVQPGDWNLRVYSHLFALPGLPKETVEARRRTVGRGVGLSDYYADHLGDVWVGSLFVTRAYFKGDHEKRTGGAYEWPGRFIFEPVTKGSVQYEWLRRELSSESCRSARVKIVLLHHGIFSQGHSAVLPFGVPTEYEEDFLFRDLFPLLRDAGVNIVFNGHNHVVNHHVVDGIHFVESSHIGTTYGPYAQMPDGTYATEPHGNPSRLFITEPGNRYFSILETAESGRLVTYSVEEGVTEVIDEVGLAFPDRR